MEHINVVCLYQPIGTLHSSPLRTRTVITSQERLASPVRYLRTPLSVPTSINPLFLTAVLAWETKKPQAEEKNLELVNSPHQHTCMRTNSATPAQQAMHCPIHFSLSWHTVPPKAMHADTEASGVVHKGMPTPPL